MNARLVLTAGVTLALSLCLAGGRAHAQAAADLGPAARQVFQKNCASCHAGAEAPRGIKVLERKVLVETKKVVVPGNPGASRLFAVITRDAMPPTEDNDGKPLARLSKVDKDTIKNWIAAGAPDFDAAPAAPPEPLITELPPEEPPARGGIPVPKKGVEAAAPKLTLDPGPKPEPGAKAVAPRGLSVDYVLGQILRDVRTLDGDTRRKVRYFSLAHLVTAGATEDELNQHRDALAKAINHLHRQPTLVRPTAVDKLQTIYRIDLRELGWDRPVLRSGAAGGSLNAFDLVLLEYPYGMIYNNTGIYTSLVRDYLFPAQMARPVPFVRADWFISRATLPPLYFELLNLPTRLKELEKELGVDAQANIERGQVVRAGMVESKVSRNNRAVERHSLPGGGYYWRSYDYANSVGLKSIVADPVNLRPDGGEMIFSLPNGLQGYFIVNKDGKRLDAAPQEIVEDTTAGTTVEGQTVHTGLSCIRCHESGMRKDFTDDIRPSVLKLTNTAFDRQRALALYPEKETMVQVLKRDEERFVKALTELLGKQPDGEPLTPVARRFEGKLGLLQAAAELGRSGTDGLDRAVQGSVLLQKAALAALTQTERPGKTPRDAWEAQFGDIARELKLGFPLVPLDSSVKLQEEPLRRPFRFSAVLNDESDKKVFKRGEEFKVFLLAEKSVFVEVIRTDTDGRQTVLTAADTRVRGGQTVQVPLRAGQGKVSGKAGKEQLTLLLSDDSFTGGEALTAADGTSRVIHRANFEQENGRFTLLPGLDPARTIKKTFTIDVK